MDFMKRIMNKIRWESVYKPSDNSRTCNDCQYYSHCSADDIPGEYYNAWGGASHNGAKICKYFEQKSENN